MVDRPTGRFGGCFHGDDPDRLSNFTRFLDAASAATPKTPGGGSREIRSVFDVARRQGVAHVTHVNFIRRTWPHQISRQFVLA